MPSCSVLICKNRAITSNLKTSGVSYHRFPKDPEIKNKWIDATGRENNWTPTNLSVICSSHFQEDCFILSTKKRMLFEWAVPTLKLRYIFENPALPQESLTVKNKPSTTPVSHYLHSEQESITVKTEPSITPITHYLKSQQESITVKTEPSTTPISHYLQSQQESKTVKTESSTTPIPLNLQSASQQEFITVKIESLTSPIPCTFTDNIDSNVADTTRKLKRMIELKDNVIKAQKLHIKRLQTTVRRYKKKVNNMKEIFSEMKEKKFINKDQALHLENMDISTRDLIIRYNTSLAAGHAGKAKYTAGLKSFAMTLHLYSPKAYEFVRQKFVTCLPHVRTIKKWKSVDAKSGFTTESLEALPEPDEPQWQD